MIGLLVLNGDKSDKLPNSEEYDVVAVCDGAYKNCKDVLERVDVVVGDFDSLGYVPTDVDAIQFEMEKDLTDGEIGLNYLLEKDVDEIHIYWGFGERVDHFLANISLLKIALDSGVVASMVSDTQEMYLVNDDVYIDEGINGKTLSLLPYSSSAHILNGRGLKYPIDNLTLNAFSSRGVSNVAVDDCVEFSIEQGEVLLIIQK